MIIRRLTDINLIPRELVEQVPEMEPNAFYSLLSDLPNQPLQFVEVFLDASHEIMGFAWAAIELTSKQIHVNTVSLRKKFQGDGQVLKEYIEHLKERLKNTKIKVVTWATDRPAFFEKLGFSRSKEVFLEYHLDKEEADG